MAKQTKEFLALQAVWDKKLKASGFVDVEQRDGNLKEWSSLFNTNSTRAGTADVSMEAKQEYYRLAGHFLHSHRFSAFERKVWELHADGISIRQIVRLLAAKHRIETYKRQVHETVQKLSKLMMEKVERENAADRNQ